MRSAPQMAGTIVVAAVCSNGSQIDLRLTPEAARHLWLDLGVALGDMPAALPSTDEEDFDQGGE